MKRTATAITLILLSACSAPAANEHLRPEYIAACLVNYQANHEYRRDWSPEQYLPHDNPEALCGCIFDNIQSHFDEDQLRYFIDAQLAYKDPAADARAKHTAQTRGFEWSLPALEKLMSLSPKAVECEQATRTKPSLIGAESFFNF